MKLVWHIFLKDLRRLAVPLALWAALLAAKYAFGWHMIRWEGASENEFKRMVGVEVMLIALECVACFLLATRLVHEDPLVGRDVFWVTRPISGARLLAAKIFGAVLFFAVLPVAIEVPWWLANHYGWAEMQPAIVEALVWQIAIVAPAMLLAVLTDGLSRVLLWTLVVAAFATWWLLLATAGAPGEGSYWRGLAWTRSCVELAVGTAMIATVVALQYLTRRRVRSIGVVVIGVIAIGLTTQVWPWNLAPGLEHAINGTLWVRGSSWGAPPAVESGGMTFTVAHARVPEFTSHTPDSWSPTLNIDYEMSGTPPDRTIIAGNVKHTWRWPDGMTIERESGFGGWWWWSSKTDAARRRVLGILSGDGAVGPISVNASAYLTRSLANRLHRDPPSYAATITVLVSRPEVAFKSPAQAEARRWLEASSVRVVGPRWRKDGIVDAVDMVTVETRPVTTRFVLTLAAVKPVQDDGRALQYWLLNEEAKSAFASPGRYGTHLDIGTVRIAWETNWISSSGETPAGWKQLGVKQGGSLDHWQLVGLAYRDDKVFQSQLNVPRFEVSK
jgi:hypothetical protein